MPARKPASGAQECEAFDTDLELKVCSQECQRCEESCRKMVGGGGVESTGSRNRTPQGELRKEHAKRITRERAGRYECPPRPVAGDLSFTPRKSRQSARVGVLELEMVVNSLDLRADGEPWRPGVIRPDVVLGLGGRVDGHRAWARRGAAITGTDAIELNGDCGGLAAICAGWWGCRARSSCSACTPGPSYSAFPRSSKWSPRVSSTRYCSRALRWSSCRCPGRVAAAPECSGAGSATATGSRR